MKKEIISYPVLKINNFNYKRFYKTLFNNLNLEFYSNHIGIFFLENKIKKDSLFDFITGFFDSSDKYCEICGVNIYASSDNRIPAYFIGRNSFLYNFFNIKLLIDYLEKIYDSWRKEYLYEMVGLLKLTPEIKVSRLNNEEKFLLELSLAFAIDSKAIFIYVPDKFDIFYFDIFKEYYENFGKKIPLLFFDFPKITPFLKLCDFLIIEKNGTVKLSDNISNLYDKFVKIEIRNYEDISKLELIESYGKIFIYGAEIIIVISEIKSSVLIENIKLILGTNVHIFQREINIEDILRYYFAK